MPSRLPATLVAVAVVATPASGARAGAPSSLPPPSVPVVGHRPPAVAGAVTGTVRDVRGGPVVGAVVRVETTAGAPVVGTVTDLRGHFRLDGLVGRLTLTVSALGYRSERRQVDVPDGASATLDVVLRDEDVAGDEVVVSTDAAEAARRSGQATAVLGERDLAAVRGATLGAALERLPGVTTLTTGPTISKPVVRGLHSERVVVVNAGLVQEGQQWGAEHAPEIDPFAPVRVEVLRGVAGVEVGLGAIGGVVRLVPRPLPETPGVGALVQADAFSNNRQGAASLLVEGATADGPRGGVAARVQASVRRAGDSRAPSYVLANTGAFERAGQAMLGWHGGPWGVDVLVSRYRTTLGVYRGAHVATADALRRLLAQGHPDDTAAAFAYTIEAPRQEITHDLATATLQHDRPGGARVIVRLGAQRNHRQEFDRHRRFETTPEGHLAFDLTLASYSLDARLRQRPRVVAGVPLVGTVGVSAMAQGNRNGAPGQLVPNFSAWTSGAFVREQASATLAGRPLRLDAGLRADVYRLIAYPRDRAAGAFVRRTTRHAGLGGALAAALDLAPRWTVGASVGTAWRPPSVNERYADGVHHGAAVYERGDPDLGRERSLAADLTLRHDGPRVSLDVGVFRTGIDGFVTQPPDTTIVTTVRGAFPLRLYRATDARLVGVDGTVAVRLVAGLSADVQGALVRGDDLAAAEPLPQMPADRVATGLAWEAPVVAGLRDARVGARVRFVDRQRRVPSVPEFAPPPPAYRVVDADASGVLTLGRVPLSLSISVSNLLDTPVRDYLSRFRLLADDPGRTVTVRVAVPLGAYHLDG